MQGLLAHMDARVEEPDGPDGRQERQHEAPPRRPCRQVIHMSEDIRAGVQGFAARDLADWQGDHGGDEQADVDEDSEGLDPGHDGAGEDGAHGVHEDEADVDAVYYAVGGGPVAVARDGDAGKEHEGEGVWEKGNVSTDRIPRLPGNRARK